MKKILISLILIPSLAFSENVTRNENQSTLYSAEGDTGPVAGVDRYGNYQCTLKAGTASASNPILGEDVGASSGQALVMAGAVNNNNLSSFNSTPGDANFFAVGDRGNLFTSLYYDSAIGSGGPVRTEDASFGDLNPVMVAGGQSLSAIAQSVGTSGDVAPVAMDLGNRLVTTIAPAGETFNNCGTATATTADVQIKANVASNRIYVTTLTCKNTSATVATSLDFKDGTTVVAVGGISQMATTAPGSFVATFPVPIRLTSNTALNFATNVSTSSVTCCAQGYLSTI